MLRPFFDVAMLAPGRQLNFRRVAVGHALFVLALAWITLSVGVAGGAVSFGYILLSTALVEGAALVGWRLTQIPKSQALEFLLVSPVQPRRVFLAEALVGVSRFSLVWLSGLPVFVLLVACGLIEVADLWPLAVMPFAWGAATSLLLTAWVYESPAVRRVGEVLSGFGILVYLVVGVLAAEKLIEWLNELPPAWATFLGGAVRFGYEWNPFGVIQYWFSRDAVNWIANERLTWVTAAGGVVALMAGTRAAYRMKAHYHDRHYKPLTSARAAQTEKIGDRPLSWWAVRRVMEYSGRVNVYLAGGFALVYAAYMVAGDAWPAWMGKLVFQLVEMWGGAAALATGLCVLATVPAVFQFGLWDSTVQNRCKRLELLLLTDLSGHDYWHASLSAAWKRGWGYFAIAGLLWVAMAVSGRAEWWGVLAAVVGSAVVWAFGFAFGFRTFSTGKQTNGLASLFTLGLPLALVAMVKFGLTEFAGLIPAGLTYSPLAFGVNWSWWVGLVALSAGTVWLTRTGLQNCETELRNWYDANQGKRSAE
ncbi:MAG: hypothetical protein MUF18_17470 [Fimbriiglobus sp.]|jgi:hypothetical protein|nr:hypothetical protein [Fimbriiglobus sp.]